MQLRRKQDFAAQNQHLSFSVMSLPVTRSKALTPEGGCLALMHCCNVTGGERDADSTHTGLRLTQGQSGKHLGRTRTH